MSKPARISIAVPFDWSDQATGPTVTTAPRFVRQETFLRSFRKLGNSFEKKCVGHINSAAALWSKIPRLRSVGMVLARESPVVLASYSKFPDPTVTQTWAAHGPSIGMNLTITSAAHAQGQQPWSVASDMTVASRIITFESGKAILSGTLHFPAGTRPRATVIALHGAGVPLRTDPLYRHLIEIMPRLGMAVFVYDRRGSGQSTSGGAAPGNFELLADDAVAAFARLSREPEIDPAHIGFWGLSQGGWLTILAAAKEQRTAFAIAVSAPMAAADVQMNYAVSNILRIRGQPQTVIDEAVRARTIVDDYAPGSRSRAEAKAAEASVRSKPWYDQIWLKGNIDDPEWRQQISADPLRALEKSRVPTLLIFGQDDPWVPVGISLASLKARAATLPKVTVRVIDSADHAIMLGVPPVQQVDTTFATHAAPNAPAYFALLGAWLQTTVGR